MIASVVIFAITYGFIASEKLDKTAAALLGAAAVIILKLVPYEHALHSIDLNVILLLVGMMLVMHIMSQTGMFEWLAVVIAQKARGNGIVILLLLLFATAFISAFLDNVTTVILIAPITILVCEILELKVVPFLILEAIFSNIGGTATLIGDPPNVIIGSQTGLSFNEFIYNLTPIVLIIVVVVLPIIYFYFRNTMVVADSAKIRILRAKPRSAIVDPVNMRRSLVIFVLIILSFFLSHSLGLEPGIIAIVGAVVMGIVCKRDLHHDLTTVEWNSVFFFVGLFMLIGALEYNGVFEKLGHLMLDITGGNLLMTVLVILWFSAIASSIVDNIPLVIAMIPLIETIVPVFGERLGIVGDEQALKVIVSDPLYWSLALGACLGGNGTLVGASANVVISQIAQRNRYPMTFFEFTRFGMPIMLLTLVLSTIYLYVRYFAMRGVG